MGPETGIYPKSGYPITERKRLRPCHVFLNRFVDWATFGQSGVMSRVQAATLPGVQEGPCLDRQDMSRPMKQTIQPQLGYGAQYKCVDHGVLIL